MSVVRVEGFIYDSFKKDDFSPEINYAYLYVSVPAVSRNKLSSGLKTFAYKVDVSSADEIFADLQRGDFVEPYFSDNSDRAKVSFVRKIDFDKLDSDLKEQFIDVLQDDLDFLDKYVS